MSIQVKFGILFLLATAIVMLSAAVAWWSVAVSQHEVIRPVDAMYFTLSEIGGIDASMARLHSMVIEEPGETDPKNLEEAAARLFAGSRQSLDRLAADERIPKEAGIGTVRSIEKLIFQAEGSVERLLVERTPEARTAAAASLNDLIRLLRLVRERKIRDATEFVEHANQTSVSVRSVIRYAVLLSLVTGILGFVLVRRWITHPIRLLRDAAVRIGQGDFDHRIDVASGDDIGQLSREVNHMASMVRAMQDERIERERLAAVGEMVRRIAHNLRNPLAGIRGLAELTRAELGDVPKDAPIAENQERIIVAVDRFERWLKDLVRVTVPTAVSPTVNPIAPWLNAVIQSLQPMALAKSVSLVVETEHAPEHAEFDPAHLEHAVVVLITNAVQATPVASKVTVSVAAAGPEHWEIRVSDQGPGVPVELAHKIFAPYFTTKKDGSGIGLALASHVALAHGGRLSLDAGPVTEKLATGATFVIRLPQKTAAHANVVVANRGQDGKSNGQNSHHRGRGEPEVLDPAHARTGRA